MRYRILDGETEINVIEADAEFVTAFCNNAGYTFEEAPLPEVPEPEPEPTLEDRVSSIESAIERGLAL